MIKKLSFLSVGILIAAAGVHAQSLSVVVPQLAPLSTETYKNMVMAIAEAGGKTVEVQVVPFARAVYAMETGQADIESAIIQLPDQKKWAALKYDYASTEMCKTVFVLYTNKAKPITVAELKSGNAKRYRLETDAAHVDHFPFPIEASTSVDASLKKVDSGVIDGFVFGQGSSDTALRRLGLKNLVRQYYDTFSLVFLLKKGARGGPIDAMITNGIAKTKASGKYQEIMGPYLAIAGKFIDWQP